MVAFGGDVFLAHLQFQQFANGGVERGLRVIAVGAITETGGIERAQFFLVEGEKYRFEFNVDGAIKRLDDFVVVQRVLARGGQCGSQFFRADFQQHRGDFRIRFLLIQSVQRGFNIGLRLGNQRHRRLSAKECAKRLVADFLFQQFAFKGECIHAALG